jgi:hypothetical protein
VEEETAVRRSPGALPVRDEEEKLQTKRSAPSSSSAPEVGPRTAARIGSLRGGGAPMSPAARGYFEPRFGRDLSAVRLHTGAAAAAAAGEVGARAFTVGSDVAFGAGEYRPDSSEGRKLLAHELVHTAQQRGDRVPVVQRKYRLSEVQAAQAASGNPVAGTPDTYFYPGAAANTTDRKALVVAGIHGDEPSAIRLGREIHGELQGGTLQPDFHSLFVPRANPTSGRGTANVADLNREFGGSQASAEPIAGNLQTMITEFEPERVLSIHAIGSASLGGLYLDPIRAPGATPPPGGNPTEREAAFTGDARNRAAMGVTEGLIDAARAGGRAGTTATAGNTPRRTFPASRYPAPAGGGGSGASSSSPYSLLYPLQSQVQTGPHGETSLGVWGSQLSRGPAVITLEVPGKSVASGGSNWRPFLPAVRRFLQLPAGGRAGAGGGSRSPQSPPPQPQPERPAGEERIQRAPELTEKDLGAQKGIPKSFVEKVYVAQVAIWKATGATYTHEVAAADRKTLAAGDVVTGKTVSVHKDIADPLDRLLAHARKDLATDQAGGTATDVSALVVRSGYRSATEQMSIWEGEFKKYYKATEADRKDPAQCPSGEHGAEAAELLARYINSRVFSPGYSPHQKGKTIDFSYSSATDWPKKDGNWAPADTSSSALATWSASWFFGWLSKNAAAYGFHQNPALNEPWHWEWRQPAAKKGLIARILELIRALIAFLLRLLGLSKEPEDAGTEETPPVDAGAEEPR